MLKAKFEDEINYKARLNNFLTVFEGTVQSQEMHAFQV